MKTNRLVSRLLVVVICMAAIFGSAPRLFGQSDKPQGDKNRGQKLEGISLGTFKVNTNGAATYSIPLAIGPGINRMQPNLSLSYSSQSQNSLTGAGWSLNGVAAIQRCPRTLAQDGVRGGIKLDTDDRFCLDASRLMVVAGTYGAQGAEYRTELDAFEKVFSNGQIPSPGSGPVSFTLKNKAGETWEFGNTTDSRIEAQGKTTVRVWALSKVTDATGNSMTITYEEDNVNGDFRPKQIDYTGNTGQSFSPQRSVQFLYEDRPDKPSLYIGGAMVKVMKRLSKIQTFAPDPSWVQGNPVPMVREYRLVYQTGTSTGRSRLTSITECDKNGACLPSTRLTWQEGANGVSHSIPPGPPLTIGSVGTTWVADFNGDGKSDVVRQISTTTLQFAFFNNNETYQLVNSTTNLPSCWATNTWTRTGDFNADGIIDWIGSNPNSNSFCVVYSRGNGVIATPATQPRLPLNWNHSRVFAGDLNGDGIMDMATIATGTSSSIILALFNVDGTIQKPAPVVLPSNWDPARTWVGDFNADGKADFASISTGGNKILFAFSNGDGTFNIPNIPGGGGLGQYWNSNSVWIGDFNGDGRLDFASLSTRIQVVFSKGDGTVDVPAASPDLPTTWDSTSIWIGDFNGDGKLDVLSRGGSNYFFAFSNGDGTFRIQTRPAGQSQVQAGTGFVGDFNGDAISDLLQVVAPNLRTTIMDGPFPDLMSSINNNLGGKIDILYKPITDPSVYTKDTDAVYPVMDVQAHISRTATYLVDSYTTRTQASGNGQNFTYTYDYGGAKFHHLGRGGLGFRFVRAVDETALVDPSLNPAIKRQITSYFNQNFPLIGLVSLSETADTQNPLNPFSQTINAYTPTNTFPGVVFSAPTSIDKKECDKQPGCFQVRDEFTYDTFGNLTLTRHKGDVSITGDDRIETTEWITDTTNWIHRPKRMLLQDFAGATVREKWLYYDDLNLTSQWGSLGTPPRGLVTKEESRADFGTAGDRGQPGNSSFIYTYDGFGNRTSVKNPIDCLTSTTYDTTTHTFPDTVTNCAGHVTKYTWDPRFGVKLSEQDPNHTQTNRVITNYLYDTFGRVTKVTGPIDFDMSSPFGSVSFNYNNFGNPTTQHIQTLTTKDHGTSTVIAREEFFDGLGRFIRNESDAPAGATIVEQFTFDSRGLMTEKFAHYFLGQTPLPPTKFVYDVLGRQVLLTRPDGFRTTEAQFLPGKVTLFDENDHQKTKTFDGYGQVIKIDEKNGVDTYSTFYDYDAAGQLTHVENALHHHTRIKYDTLGRKIALCDPNMGAGPNVAACDTSTPGAWLYTYDKAGNLLTQADAVLRSHSQFLTFQYDSLSRVTTKTYPSGGGTITFTYDQGINGTGRLSQVNDLGGVVTSYSYDKMGRSVQTDRTIDVLHRLTQSYNALNKVLTETISSNGQSGEPIDYTYDEAGRLNSVVGYVNSIIYNARGQKEEIHYFNNVVTTFDYFDQAIPGQKINFRVKNRTTDGPNSNYLHLQNLDYDYDPVGNMTSITDHLFTATRPLLRYDDLDRLIEASGNFDGTNQGQNPCPYSYSPIGDVLNKCNIQYTYGDANHPSFVTATSDGNTYAPDLNGNTLTGAGRIFTWTADNRASSITAAAGATIMDYDYTGARLKKGGPAGFGLTVYPFANYEIDSDGTNIKYFTLDNQILGAKKSSGEKLFYHNDHLGGVNVVTDIAAARTELMEYDPWGKLSRQESSGSAVDPTHGFTGQELDKETDLYFYGGRYYDQQLARFVQPDPFVTKPDDPQNFNRYSYVRNNPYRYIDPTGYDDDDPGSEEEGGGEFGDQMCNFEDVPNPAPPSNPPADPPGNGVPGTGANPTPEKELTIEKDLNPNKATDKNGSVISLALNTKTDPSKTTSKETMTPQEKSSKTDKNDITVKDLNTKADVAPFDKSSPEKNASKGPDITTREIDCPCYNSFGQLYDKNHDPIYPAPNSFSVDFVNPRGGGGFEDRP